MSESIIAEKQTDTGGPAFRRGNNLIAIASGKGGVGKTWFSITLSHALAREGKVGFVKYSGEHFDIGSLEGLKEAEKALRAKTAKKK